MANDYFPVEPLSSTKPPRRTPKSLTPESKFWRTFKSSELPSDLVLPITGMEFSPAPPYHLAATASASVLLYDGANDLSSKTPISSPFSDLAFSPSFRCDGALLAAGSAAGLVYVLNLSKLRGGSVLRRLRAHSRPVHVVRYPRTADKLHVLSGGDDTLLAYWDVAASDSPLISVPAAHKDYIRAGVASPVSPSLFATGSYDHYVKLWDFRAGNNATLGLNHGYPVESVAFLPSGGLIATAGGNCVKIFDVIGGGRLIHSMETHNKTVTSLCLARIGSENVGGGGESSRLLSVSIDGYLKIFDFAAMKITHSMRYPAQLLSVAFSPSGSARVVGTSNGTIYLGKKKIKKEGMESEDANEFSRFLPEPEKPVLRTTNYRYFHRGQGEKPKESDYVVKKTAKVKLAEHDKLLKKFRHREALVSALNCKNPESVVAVMEELVGRKKLLKCVENLDVDELGLLLAFLHKYATMPRYARLLMGLAKRVLEMRAEDIQSSEQLRGHVKNLKRVVGEELQIQHSLQEIQGMISPLLVIAGR